MRIQSAPANGTPSAGYPLFGGRLSRAQRTAMLVGIGSGILLALLYHTYLATDDIAPDSVFGLGFAIAGTALLLVVGIGFAMRKRLRRHWVGRLHTALAWHIVGGVVGLALIFMHAAGNFNPRSGTYALYGVIALVISGGVGRILDRLCPRLAASSSLSALSLNGEDQPDVLEQRPDASVAHARPPLDQPTRSATGTTTSSHLSPANSLWDLAYHDLNAASRAVPILVGQSVPGRALHQAAPPRRQGSRTQRREARRQADMLQTTLGHEQFFLQLVRVWRRLHTALSVVTLGLLVWHLIYAATLVL